MSGSTTSCWISHVDAASAGRRSRLHHTSNIRSQYAATHQITPWKLTDLCRILEYNNIFRCLDLTEDDNYLKRWKKHHIYFHFSPKWAFWGDVWAKYSEYSQISPSLSKRSIWFLIQSVVGHQTLHQNQKLFKTWKQLKAAPQQGDDSFSSASNIFPS